MDVTLVRVRFAEAPGPGEHTIMEFKDPETRLAVASSLELQALAAPPAAERSEELLVLQVPAGTGRDAPGRAQAQAWFEAPAAQDVPPVHAGFAGVSVRWRPGRAVLEAPADRMEQMLLAVVDFAFHEHELHRLEAEIDADWPVAEADAPLMSHVGRAELARAVAVAGQGTQAALRRLRCARMEGGLFTPPAMLDEAARRLGEELRDKSDLETRLEILDGRIEVYEYIYEVAGQRISDYRHFRREYAVEIIIAAILAIEVLLVAYEVYLYFQE